ncbi:MAG: MBL fold metallo-hydrolase [Myxococcota bacterium]|jgi:glyoxylase-like metal-dependent hydrolase (beta-lactamase superfamily II)
MDTPTGVIPITFTGFDGPGEPPNAYIIPGDPLTVIDAGVRGPENQRILTDALDGIGKRPSDIGQVVLTHWHWDHTGLAEWISERSGAVFIVHQSELSRLSADNGELGMLLDDTRSFFWHNGVPRPLAEAIVALAFQHGVARLGAGRLRAVADGDMIATGNGPLRVVHTPGHTPGSICLFDDATRTLFSSDNLYGRLFPHPVAEIYEPGRIDRSVIGEYVGSLELLKALGAGMCFPGHGAPFADISKKISLVSRFIERRQARLLRLLAPGPMSAGEVLSVLFPAIGQVDQLYAVAEVIFLLETLETAKKARRIESADLVRYGLS